MVLFLFVIMLVNQQHLMESDKYGPNRWLAIGVAVVLGLLFAYAFLPAGFVDRVAAPAAFSAVDGANPGNSQAIAWLLYRQYLMPFEIVSVFLLVAMIGAVVLGRRQ
jgi:NADH-quinone oxidoreductase subunit J